MEFVATLQDQISSPAEAGRAALAALRAELGAVGEALRGLPAVPAGLKAPAAPKAPKAAPVAGGAEAGKATAWWDDKVARGDDKRAAERVKQIEKWNALKGKEADKYQAKYLKDKEKEEREKAKPAKKGGNQLEELNKNLGTAQTLVKVAAAVSFARSIGELAIGYRGMAQMQALTARAQYNVRQLFTGVNPAPLIRAYDRFLQTFSKSSVTGQALSGIFERVFNGIFALIERAEPYITAFTQGMVIAFLTAETAIVRVRIALLPYMSALEGIVTSTGLLKVASIAGSAALVGAAAYATVAAAPFLALAAAILAVAAAFEQASKLAKEWDENSAHQIWNKIKSDITGGNSDADLGISSGAEYDAISRRKAMAAAAADAKKKAPVAGAAAAPVAGAGAEKAVVGVGAGATPLARAAGQTAGAAMGAGFVAGMKGTEDAVAKGGAALAGAADKGVKVKAEIKSPSGLMRRRGGQMGEGAALGMEDSEGRVQAAGAAALVPSDAGGGAVGRQGAGGITIQQIGPFMFPESMGAGAAADLESAINRGINDAFEAVAIRFGVGQAVIG